MLQEHGRGPQRLFRGGLRADGKEEEAGDFGRRAEGPATLVKLFRVTLLAPVVLCFSLAIRARGGAEAAGSPRPPLVPGFVLAFLALATVNSIGLVPAVIRNFVSDLSRWALLVAIAAVGMKTSLRTILDVGGQAIVLIVAETTFLAIFILAGLHLLN